jgi:hypothetical protein
VADLIKTAATEASKAATEVGMAAR